MEKSTNLGSVHISGCSTLRKSDPRIGWSLFFHVFFWGGEGDLVKKGGGGGLVSN